MKKFLKRTGIVLGVLIVLVLICATVIHFRGIPTYNPPAIADIKVEATAERVAQGQKIASMLCTQCHSNDNNVMTGKRLVDLPPLFGEIYSMNITHDTEKGIGNWTDGEIIYFLRTGLRKNGTYAPPYMPKFPLLSDEDIKSVVAWLRSDAYGLQANSEEAPASKPSLFTKVLCTVLPPGKPLPYPTAEIPSPDTTNKITWGKYLATGLYGCFACHSADFAKNNDLEPEKSAGFFGGGNSMLNLKGETIKSRNITPDGATGIGSWSEDDFIRAMTTGKRKNGKQFKYPMVPYTQLTEGELKAIYAYLQTVPPIVNNIEE
jgi:mono/diheme cytochrome c family protein